VGENLRCAPGSLPDLSRLSNFKKRAPRARVPCRIHLVQPFPISAFRIKKSPHKAGWMYKTDPPISYNFFLRLLHPKTISIARLSLHPSCRLGDGPCYSVARPRWDPNVICRGDPVDIVSVSGDFPALCAPMSLTVYPLEVPSGSSVLRLLSSSPHPSEVLVS